jgi:flagella basal body P-ring formation protein FlgA
MKNLLVSSLALTAALALSPATLAAPALRANVTVKAAVVTVGDMFADAGLLAEKGLFRAPAPGTAGNVSLADIRAAAARAGLTDFDTEGLASVQVARAGVAVDGAMLSRLIAGDLRQRGILVEGASAETRFSQALPALTAAATAEPVKLVTLRYMPGSDSFTARFAVAGMQQPLDISGHINLMIEVPHLAASLGAGTVLAADDIEMRKVPLKIAESSGYLDADQLVGKALQHPSRAGMMLKASDVAAPELITRNEPVTVYFRQGAMTLTVKGKALNDAALGEPVSVLNALSKKVITGVAAAGGAVEVKSATLSVAGL